MMVGAEASPVSFPVARPRLLKLWASIQVAAATAVFIAVAATNVVDPRIALRWPGLTPEASIVAGLAFWLILGLAGGQRAKFRAGGAVLTFSMPFIVAGTALGGPFAGALMGLLAEFELREVQTQPWYGTLANHAVAILAAVAAALVGEPVYAGLDQLIPGNDSLVFFVSTMAMALTFVIVNVVLVIPTLAMKGGLSLAEARHTPDASFRATAIAEAILAWNLAATYLMVGWWASIAVVGLVVIVWQHHDRGEALRRDSKTGLLNDAGLQPRLAAAVDAAAIGRRPAALLFIDLDRFKRINDDYLERAGDEVLIVTSRRILMTVRAMDSVSRLHGGGDEFAVLLEGVPDADAARHIASRIRAAICEPIRLRSTPATVSVGASIGVVAIERGTTRTVEDILDLADARMQSAKRLAGGIDAESADDLDAQARRTAKAPRRSEPGPNTDPPSSETDGEPPDTEI